MTSEVPPRVIAVIKHHIETLNALVIGRQTDAKFNGQGRYEAEAYLNRKDEIEVAWNRIAEFEAKCSEHGINPATVYGDRPTGAVERGSQGMGHRVFSQCRH